MVDCEYNSRCRIYNNYFFQNFGMGTISWSYITAGLILTNTLAYWVHYLVKKMKGFPGVVFSKGFTTLHFLPILRMGPIN
jgi:hypothetical protein